MTRAERLQKKLKWDKQQLILIKAMKPSARKSCGSYKPVIIHSNGRTEVVQKGKMTAGGRNLRGTVYSDRWDAVYVATEEINRRKERKEDDIWITVTALKA